MQNLKILKLYGAFLAGISLPEPMTMAKSSTNSDSNHGCDTEADVEDEDLEAEGQDLLLSPSYLMMMI